MGCQPRCDVTYIRTVVVVVGIEYYYVDGIYIIIMCILLKKSYLCYTEDEATSAIIMQVYMYILYIYVQCTNLQVS